MQHIGEYFTRGLAFAGIAIAMAACSPAKATNPQDGASPPPLVAISFPAEVHAGTSLPLTVTLTNPTPEPVSIALGGSATRIQFDIAVTATDGGEVWRYALTDVGQASVNRPGFGGGSVT